jgi:TonB family protein
VRVNRQGKVVSWRTLDGNRAFREAALKAAKKATFSPQKLGDITSVLGTITYSFKP